MRFYDYRQGYPASEGAYEVALMQVTLMQVALMPAAECPRDAAPRAGYRAAVG